MKVRATSTVAVRLFPGIRVVAEDEEFDSSDPIVKAHPWLFSADNVGPEAASAAPGEMRSVKRAAKKAAPKSDA